MKHLRLLILLVLLVTLNGCVTTRRYNFITRNQVYRKIEVTDYQGKLVSNWIAEGWVWRYGPGYRFVAMERFKGPPYAMRTRYPHGRKVIINAPNIIVTPIDKPEWLRQQDGF